MTALTLSVPPEVIDAIARRVVELTAAQRAAVADASADLERERLMVTKLAASEALGMSVDHFERHVMPELRTVRSGRLRLVPVSELRDWINRNASLLPKGGETGWTDV
jgi:hypothetical protein